MSALLVALLLSAAPAEKPAASPPAEAARSVVVLSDLGMGPAAPIARELNDAVNQEVRRSLSYAWRDPPAISVDELLLALNCTTMDEACLKRAAENLKTDAIVFVFARTTPQGSEVVLTLVHSKPPRPAKSQAVTMKDPATTQAELRQAARALLGPVKPTRLSVSSTPAAAEVLMDGKPVGVTPLALNDIPEGQHALVLRLAGYQERSVNVNLGAGESQELNVALVAGTGPSAVAATGTGDAPESPMRKPLLATGGVALALGGVVMATALLLMLGGASSWATYFAVGLLNPGFLVNGQKIGGQNFVGPCVGNFCFTTAPVFFVSGVLAYALFFPGLAAAVLGALVLAVGGVIAAVPVVMGGRE